MKPFRSSYNRIIYLTCFALLLISLAIEGIQYLKERDSLLKDLKTQVDEYASNLNVRARTAQGYVNGLRNAAQQYLFYIDKYDLKSPLYSYLGNVPDEDIYTLNVKSIDKSLVGNLTGLGELDQLPRKVHQELHMALLLNTGFQIALQNNLGAVWIYYTSLSGFHNLYPWLPSSHRSYYVNVIKTPVVMSAGPEMNPSRSNVWSRAYEDGRTVGSRYHRGLIVTNAAPVYFEDEYIGAVCMDISLKELSRVVGNFTLPTGSLILMSTHKEVLSYQSSNDEEEDLEAFLTSSLGLEIIDMSVDPPRDFVKVGDKLVYMRSLSSAPWVLAYVVSPRALFEQDFIHGVQDILIIALSLIFVVGMGYFVVTRDFISPAQKLVNHIEKENQGQKTTTLSDLPEGWREWFEIVSKIFAENRTLLDELEGRVKRRTQQLQKKNLLLEKTLDDLKKAQNQIIVQEKLASLGALTAGIAHEIKNPLHFIINFSEVSFEELDELAKEFPNQADQIKQIRQNLERVIDHAQRADSIVKGMLSHARSGDGTFEMTDINQLVKEAIDLAYLGFCGTAHHFHLQIKRNLDNNIPKVNVSPQELSRVVLNIVNNACFAMHEKLESDTKDYKPTLKVDTKKEKKAILLVIEDNGTGIPKSAIKKIFNPFFTTKEDGQGTGLGLSLSYEIITQQHHGEMWIESEPEKFSRFFIRIPC